MTILDAAQALATNPWAALYGALAGSPLVAGVTLIVITWLRKRKHDARNAAQSKASELEHDAAVAPPLLARIATLEQRTDDCHRGREEDRKRHEEQRQRDREECEKHTAREIEKATTPLREALSLVAGKVRDSLAADDTGVHALDAIVSQTPAPPVRAATMVPPARDPEAP